jgi:hypothetical protein
MRHTYVSILIVSALIIAFFSLPALAGTDLSVATVKAAFSGRLNEESNPYDPDAASIQFFTGSFTAAGKDEAVVWFLDNNQSHVAAAAELWLLRDSGGWKPILMIDQSDEITARRISEGAGEISAVFYSSAHFSTGGFVGTYGSLVSLVGTKAKSLFSEQGNEVAFYDMYKEIGDKEAIVRHQVDFRDIFGDGMGQLIDTELIGTFVNTGKGDAGYEIRWTPKKTTTYRLVTDKAGDLTGIEKIAE